MKNLIFAKVEDAIDLVESLNRAPPDREFTVNIEKESLRIRIILQ